MTLGVPGPELHSLPLFHRIAGQRVVVVGDGAMAAAKCRLIERAGGVCCTESEAGAVRLAFVALENGVDAAAAAARLKARGLLVNVADRPELCDFTLPSILERGEVLVAVSTGGASAGLAKHLRLRLEGLLPASLGALAAALKGARAAMRGRWPEAKERRRAIDDALSERGVLDPFAPGNADRVAAWLADSPRPEASQRVEITLVSGDPDDLTLGQARLLGMADVVIHDPEVPPAILARLRADAVVTTAEDGQAEAAGLVVRLRSSPASQ